MLGPTPGTYPGAKINIKMVVALLYTKITEQTDLNSFFTHQWVFT
jgi:hypothetical protein